MVKIKRVYEDPARGDGYRVLVDRLWPRGVKKENLSFNEWPKEVCPSTEIRKFFNHDPKKFSEFRKLYMQELRQAESQQKIQELAKLAKKKNLTLLYAAHDHDINHARILKEVIDKAILSKTH